MGRKTISVDTARITCYRSHLRNIGTATELMTYITSKKDSLFLLRKGVTTDFRRGVEPKWGGGASSETLETPTSALTRNCQWYFWPRVGSQAHGGDARAAEREPDAPAETYEGLSRVTLTLPALVRGPHVSLVGYRVQQSRQPRAILSSQRGQLTLQPRALLAAELRRPSVTRQPQTRATGGQERRWTARRRCRCRWAGVRLGA